ncbi:putative MFS transporter superfamily [Helianthus anomalus]
MHSVWCSGMVACHSTRSSCCRFYACTCSFEDSCWNRGRSIISAPTDLIARLIPMEERSRAVSFVFGGLSVESVLGLLLAPPLIEFFGWVSVFYIVSTKS